jgi:hypothetical protein
VLYFMEKIQRFLRGRGLVRLDNIVAQVSQHQSPTYHTFGCVKEALFSLATRRRVVRAHLDEGVSFMWVEHAPDVHELKRTYMRVLTPHWRDERDVDADVTRIIYGKENVVDYGCTDACASLEIAGLLERDWEGGSRVRLTASGWLKKQQS